MKKIIIIFIVLIVLSLIANLLITRDAIRAKHRAPAGTSASP
jgi:hypothetical protein